MSSSRLSPESIACLSDLTFCLSFSARQYNNLSMIPHRFSLPPLSLSPLFPNLWIQSHSLGIQPRSYASNQQLVHPIQSIACASNRQLVYPINSWYIQPAACVSNQQLVHLPGSMCIQSTACASNWQLVYRINSLGIQPAACVSNQHLVHPTSGLCIQPTPCASNQQLVYPSNSLFIPSQNISISHLPSPSLSWLISQLVNSVNPFPQVV